MEGVIYTTGEFARKAGVSVRTIRYYDKQGILKPSHVSESGYRLYINEVSYGELALGEAVVGGDFDGWQLYVDRGDGNTLKFGILA